MVNSIDESFHFAYLRKEAAQQRRETTVVRIGRFIDGVKMAALVTNTGFSNFSRFSSTVEFPRSTLYSSPSVLPKSHFDNFLRLKDIQRIPIPTHIKFRSVLAAE